MSLQLSTAFFCTGKNSHFKRSNLSHVSAACLDYGVGRVAAAKSSSVCIEETRQRIVDLIKKPKFSVSTYDTAWVAMVPAPHSSEEPCFPDCLNWLLENQCHDGSWGLPHHHSFLCKDVLSSTLACILALKRWAVGADQINRGIHFIESNFASVTGKDQIAPLGFNVIFTGMLEYARDLSLDVKLDQEMLNNLSHKRNLELKRWYEGNSMEFEVHMAFLSEGIGKLQDWDSIMKFKRNNGSLFNSPSTTAAACIFHQNNGCFDYLNSALKTFGNAVPTIYPLNMYAQLCTVDNLQRLGISQYFQKEIQSALDEIYRCWLQGDEEIFMDASTCALAFKILRVHGYDVTSDKMTDVLEAELGSGFPGGHVRDMHRTLDSYRASEMIFPGEAALEKQNLRLKGLLEHDLSDGLCYSNELGRNIGDEVKHALQYPSYAVMGRVANRRYIEHYNSQNTRVLKSSFCSPNLGCKDFLFLSVLDFNKVQKMHQEELKELERWVVENRLNELKFARQKSAYCYFSSAATISSPELSDARMSWAKNGVLTTVVDDFFDVGGSLEELNNLIQLLKAWDVDVSKEGSSQNVLILFSALKSTICDIGDKAFTRQGRNVTKQIVNIWLELLESMLKETEWMRDGYTPTMDEYMNNAYTSFALGPIVLPALYLVGPKLSVEVVQHPEYKTLFKLMSTCGRLLNDIQGYERELGQSKDNAVTLYMMSGAGDISKEVAFAGIRRMIDSNRRELQRLVLDQSDNTVMPRACKDMFWHMSTVVHQFYIKDDGFTSDELTKVVKSIIYEPIVLSEF